VIAGCCCSQREPPSAGDVLAKAVPMKAVLREIRTRRSVYLRFSIGLAFSATDFLARGPGARRFLARTYAGRPAHIGKC